MLTESERKWLEQRKPGDWCSYIDCSAWCDRKVGRSQTPYCFSQSCYLDQPSVYRDAAEFSERVAAKLAHAYMGIIDAEFDMELPNNCAACPCKGRCNLDCKDSILKWARLQVEEEMDGA